MNLKVPQKSLCSSKCSMLSDQDLKASNLKAQSSQQITYNQKWQIKYDLPEAATVGIQTLMCQSRIYSYTRNMLMFLSPQRLTTKENQWTMLLFSPMHIHKIIILTKKE